MDFPKFFEFVAEIIDLVGVIIIVIGSLIGTVRYLYRYMIIQSPIPAYDLYRKELGHSILLCLEFLVAADIIRTVAIEPTLESITVLAILILIRTFVSWTLELEINNAWPWEKRHHFRTAWRSSADYYDQID